MNDSNDKKILKCEQNKICTLPDAVLHHILSFLDMKQVVATSLLSTRWRYLWVSARILNFDDSYWGMTWNDDTMWGMRFMNFVDSVLLLRDASSVSKLQISCSCCYSDRLNAWLTVATRRQFQEVHLRLLINKPIELPRLLFSSSITVLELDAKANSGYQIEIPGEVCSAPLLKTLLLHNFEFPEGNSEGELVFDNPVLESLTLINCYIAHLEVLNISTCRLKYLVFQNRNDESIGSCQIKIHTPNLLTIDFGGFWYENCCLGNLPSLVCAKFDFRSAKIQYLVKILACVSCPVSLQISACLEDGEELPYMLTQPYNNITCLVFSSWGHNRRSNYYLLLLLNVCPCLEALYLHTYGIVEEECLLPITFNRLKYVDIQWLTVRRNELKLLKFLLKNAFVLEKLTIRMDIAWGDLRAKQRFGDKIHSLYRGSSKLTVLLL